MGQTATGTKRFAIFHNVYDTEWEADIANWHTMLTSRVQNLHQHSLLSRRRLRNMQP